MLLVKSDETQKCKVIGIMKSILLIMPLIFCCLYSAGSKAESLAEYANTCKAALKINTIPGFSCIADGVRLARRPTMAVGRVETENPDVYGAFLCRNLSFVDNATTKVGVAGYILHNTMSGATCFFDTADTTPGLNSEGIVGPDSPSASTYWKQPIRYSGEGVSVTACYRCHANDPIVVSPIIVDELASFDLLNRGDNLVDGPYWFVGETFGVWNLFKNDALLTEGQCGSACHRSSSRWKFNAMKESYIRNDWMPPRDIAFFAQALPIAQGFDLSLKGWRNTGSYNWRRQTDATPSLETGPNGGYLSSHYLYLETSRGQANSAGQSATLESDWFDSRDAKLDFYYHMHGQDIGSLIVEVYKDGSWNRLNPWNPSIPWLNPPIWVRQGQQHASSNAKWTRATVDLDRENRKGLIRVRFRAIAKGGYRGDIAIDNVRIYRGPAKEGFIAKTFQLPKRLSSNGRGRQIWRSQNNGIQYCNEQGYTRYWTGGKACGERGRRFVDFRDNRWQSRSSGSTDKCYDIFSTISCLN